MSWQQQQQQQQPVEQSAAPAPQPSPHLGGATSHPDHWPVAAGGHLSTIEWRSESGGSKASLV